MIATACGGQPAGARVRACRVPGQLAVIELRKDAANGARSTLRLEQLAANEPNVPQAGFTLTVPAGWRVAGGTYVIEPPPQIANQGGRVFLTARGATGTASWPEIARGSEPGAVTADVTILLPVLDSSLPATDRPARSPVREEG